MNEILPVISVISTLCAIVFGYAAFARNGKKDTEDEARADATVLTEIGYIKANTDDIKRKQERGCRRRERRGPGTAFRRPCPRGQQRRSCNIRRMC